MSIQYFLYFEAWNVLLHKVTKVFKLLSLSKNGHEIFRESVAASSGYVITSKDYKRITGWEPQLILLYSIM